MATARKLTPNAEPTSTQHNDFQYYFDLAGEICRRAEHKDHLSDDEIIILSMVASQLTMAKYVEPGERDSDDVLNKILGLLDHEEVNRAIMSKMTTMLSDYAQSRTRLDAPSGKLVKNLGVCDDPNEPASDPNPIQAKRLTWPSN
jgi:hypothetical protein